MTWNNLEKQSKDKLKERQIQPSKEAWEAISEQLDTVEEPRKSKVLWYAIAAGFIGLLMISVLFFNTTEVSDEPFEIVNTPAETTKEAIKTEIEGDREASQLPVPEGHELASEEFEKALDTDERQEQQAYSTPKDETIAEASELEIGKEQITTSEETLIETKIAEVIAQVNLLEQGEGQVSDAEVDSLLRRAQREILSDKIFRQDQTVDAMALLSEVENELDQTFRDQIFEKLKTGFIKVRTAVADRNN